MTAVRINAVLTLDSVLHDVLQVFHSLLKAHAVEARAVVRQALEILTPAMPGRMEDGNVCLSATCAVQILLCLLNDIYCVVFYITSSRSLAFVVNKDF